LLAFARDSRVIYKGSYSKLIDSAFKRESKCCAKRVMLKLNRATRLARVKRGYLGSKQATRAINVRAIKLSLILGGYNLVSLYKAKVYIILYTKRIARALVKATLLKSLKCKLTLLKVRFL